MEQDKRAGLDGHLDTEGFIHYIAAKKLLQKQLGDEVEVTDEEFDRWLIDGELRASLTNGPNSVLNYRHSRYGSKIGPPNHDPSTFILIDELCSYYYSKEDMEQFRPSNRWINRDQWSKRWMNFGYSRQEVEPLINGCLQRVVVTDAIEPELNVRTRSNPPYFICIYTIDPTWEWTWASPPIYQSSHIVITDTKTDDEVYLIGLLPIDIIRIGDDRFAVFEDGLYKLSEGDLLTILARAAKIQ